MKLVIWISLFMIFLARAKEENEEIAGIRGKSMKYALYLWGVYYIVMLVKGTISHDLQVADNSVGIVYMIINVLCWEFFLQIKKGLAIKPLKCFNVKPTLKTLY